MPTVRPNFRHFALAACCALGAALSFSLVGGESQPGGRRIVIQPDGVPGRSETTVLLLPSSSPPTTLPLPDLRGPLGAILRWVTEPPTTTPRTSPVPHSLPRRMAPPAAKGQGGGACGGDLPPCYVCQRESRCTYGIVSTHTGCSGWHCYGKWQFDPTTWRSTVRRDHLVGVPDWPLTDWASVTPTMEDEVAAALWAHGAGCAHWNAC